MRYHMRIFLLALVFLSVFPSQAFAQTSQQTFFSQAQTPPMGWNSWNRFSCVVNESIIKQQADALVSSGMKTVGYTYVIIDDCWQGTRDGSGVLQPDQTKFPNGIKSVADYVHGKGLKLGIYTDVAGTTCQGRVGSLNFEQKDMNTFASWGIDYVKVDWCNHNQELAPNQYIKYRDAIIATGRQMILSICNWGE